MTWALRQQTLEKKISIVYSGKSNKLLGFLFSKSADWHFECVEIYMILFTSNCQNFYNMLYITSILLNMKIYNLDRILLALFWRIRATMLRILIVYKTLLQIDAMCQRALQTIPQSSDIMPPFSHPTLGTSSMSFLTLILSLSRILILSSHCHNHV